LSIFDALRTVYQYIGITFHLCCAYRYKVAPRQLELFADPRRRSP
jgi:hypothetical protein